MFNDKREDKGLEFKTLIGTVGKRYQIFPRTTWESLWNQSN